MKRCPQCNRVESDDALTFCRADGTALVTDLSSLGTPSVASEIETSILPHTTDTAISRATAPTPVLPAAQTAPTTHALAKPTQRKVLVAMVVLFVVVGIAIAGYFYIAGKRERAIESVAVLPFENKSNDADTEYLSDGLAESLIYRLSQLPNLKVSPTSSVFRYKGKELDAQKIAADLGVTAVMTGRMVQRGQNLTISVELIDAKSNKLLWGEQFERKMSDLLATQREIAAAITEKLQLKLSGEDAKGITKHYTENNEAYQAYLKGRYYWRQRGGKNISTGIGYFQEAIKLDPNFALAWSGLADSYVLLPEYTTTLVSEALPKAKQAAQKASELDSALAEAHASLGYINYVYEWNFAAADNEFRKSIELNPNYTTAHQWYAEMLTFTGRNDEALTQAKKAVELEPLSALQKFIYGVVLYDARKYDEAAKQVDAGLELDPDFARLNQFKAQNAIERGDFKGALEACQKAMAADARVYKYCPALVYAKQGDRNRAYKTISGPLVGGAIGESNLALIYALLGDKDKAFESLDKLYREKSAFVVYSKAFPSFDNLRGDPRYKDLLKKVGLPE